MIDKKIKYILSSVMTTYMKENHPQYVDFMEAYLDFLDNDDTYNLYNKAINITDNVDYNKIFPELLDYFIEQYAFEFGDTLNRYDFPDDVKRLIINNASFINNLKGTKNSFHYMLRTLQNFGVDDVGSKIGRITTQIFDNEQWWAEGKKFTYEIELSQAEDAVEDVIRLLHPAGMDKMFLLEPIVFNDIVTLNITANATGQINDDSRHDGQYLRDGSIHYGYIDVTPLTFTG